MKRKRNATRWVFAGAMTVLVAALLGVAWVSIGVTGDYELSYHGAVMKDDVPVWGDGTLNDPDQRIHLLLNSAPANTASAQVKAIAANTGIARTDATTIVRPDKSRQRSLEVAVVVFSLFGLFVLWWGRDRASLWLGLFCAFFGPVLVQFYGALPATGMFVATLIVSVLEVISFYALYRLAEAVALETLHDADGVRAMLRISGACALATALLMVVCVLGEALPPVVADHPVAAAFLQAANWINTFGEAFLLALGPLTLLTIASLRGREAARGRARIILVTTALGLSGVVFSLLRNALNPSATGSFDWFWFTLICIPLGFLITIWMYGVVEVKVVINRILVLTLMSLILGAAITASETLIDDAAKQGMAYLFGGASTSREAPWEVGFFVAFAIVLSFSRLHAFVDDVVKRIVFRRRDEGVAALHEFAVHRASFVTARKALLEQAVTLVQSSVGAQSAAIYQECSGGFECAAARGDWTWPPLVNIDDPAFVALRSDTELLQLDSAAALESALGTDGVAVRMAIGGRVTGALVVLPRANEGDGPYVREELDAFDDIGRGVADALFTLRSTETTAFVRAVADGRIGGAEASRRAQALCDCDAPVAPVSTAPARIETLRSVERA